MIACKSNAGINFGCPPRSQNGNPPHRHGFVTRWFRKLEARIFRRIPAGYEDETGFHYGIQPKPEPPQTLEKK
jgi:hypothetical protein